MNIDLIDIVIFVSIFVAILFNGLMWYYLGKVRASKEMLKILQEYEKETIEKMGLKDE